VDTINSIDEVERIYRLISAKELNQSEIARALGISPSTVNKIANGKKLPAHWE
jgi:transcriptional regulator with XRE-family HTH domain